MDPSESPNCLANLDAEAISIIRQRLPALHALFQKLQAINPQWHDALKPHNHELLLQLLHSTERTLKPHVWRDCYLLPLAEKIDVRERVEETLLHQCWKADYFDMPISGRLKRPNIQNIFSSALAVLRQKLDTHSRIDQLVKKQVCRDKVNAQYVVETFWCRGVDYVQQGMIGRARGVILAYIGLGPIGLLHSSKYPATDELFLLERKAATIAQMTTAPEQVLGALRADIVALRQAITNTNPALWKQHLLYELPGSEERLRYQTVLTVEDHAQISKTLAQLQACDRAQAEVLLDTLITRGLPGLIDLRCAETLQAAGDTLARRQIEQELHKQLAALHPDARRKIQSLIEHVQAVVDELQLPFPLKRLLREYPFSPFRKTFSARLSFGASARLRRHHHYRKPGHNVSFQPRPKLRRLKQAFPQKQEEALLNAFASRSGLTLIEARHALSQLITIGLPGLLPPKERIAALDFRLVENLHLLRLGHLDGALSWHTIVEQSAKYAQALEIEPLSPHLAISTFRSFGKPRNWHGGEGEATATTSKRFTLSLDVDRLNERWLVVPVPLPLRVLDPYSQSTSKTTYVLLMLESATSYPVSCWASAHEWRERELCLALYQSIWHPGATHFPLHGIPRVLEVPTLLAHQQLPNLEQSAQWLMTSVERVRDQRWGKLDIVKQLREKVPDWIQNASPAQPRTISDAQKFLLQWLDSKFYTGKQQTAPVPASIRKHGVAMAGHRTMAAGWLLPYKGKVKAIAGGVTDSAIFYTSPNFAPEIGTSFYTRAFPYSYPNMEHGIFIEIPNSAYPRLEYVIAQ